MVGCLGGLPVSDLWRILLRLCRQGVSGAREQAELRVLRIEDSIQRLACHAQGGAQSRPNNSCRAACVMARTAGWRSLRSTEIA